MIPYQNICLTEASFQDLFIHCQNGSEFFICFSTNVQLALIDVYYGSPQTVFTTEKPKAQQRERSNLLKILFYTNLQVDHLEVDFTNV